LEEIKLIESIKKGDNLSFKILIDLYKSKIYNTSLSILQNQLDAEDLVQEVFLEIYNSIKDFKGDSKLSTWIYQITIRKAIDELRKRKRKKRFAIIYRLTTNNEQQKTNYDKPDFIHPGVILENKEKAAILFKSIDKLPPNQKIAYTLNKIEGLSYEETAKIMKTSVPSVESLLQRAKENLRKYLYSYYTNEILNK
jgi:RNA polymerase sigma factor (sigma-70 family)